MGKQAKTGAASATKQVNKGNRTRKTGSDEKNVLTLGEEKPNILPPRTKTKTVSVRITKSHNGGKENSKKGFGAQFAMRRGHGEKPGSRLTHLTKAGQLKIGGTGAQLRRQTQKVKKNFIERPRRRIGKQDHFEWEPRRQWVKKKNGTLNARPAKSFP